MDTGTGRGWKPGKVDDEVPYLTEEIVLISVPVGCTIFQHRSHAGY